MRNAGRLKLGYYPLPVEEARNLRNLLVAPQPFFAVDPCAGDGTALVEITGDLPAHNAAVELDADRAAAAVARGIATTHGSTFESHLPAGSCSLSLSQPALRRGDGPTQQPATGTGFPRPLLRMAERPLEC